MATWPYPMHMDRKLCLTGVHAAGTTTWTLPFNDSTIDLAVLSDDFGATAGTVITLTRPTASTATASGDYSAGCAMLGRLYTPRIALSPPWVRNRQTNVGQRHGTTRQKWLTISHKDTIKYRARCEQDGRASRTESFDTGTTTVEERGDLKCPTFLGSIEEITMFIEGTTPHPAIITSLLHVVDYEPRLSRR